MEYLNYLFQINGCMIKGKVHLGKEMKAIAQVRFYNSESEFKTKTDSKGQFELAGVTFGKYTMSVVVGK